MATLQPDPQFSTSSSESLGLLVWLGELVAGAEAHGIVHGLDFDTPRTIGRFRLEALLGTGAYGAVFRATDTHLGRRVALKLAWPRVLMDPESSRRFVEEPKTVAALSHRGIVEVFDFGQIDLAWFIALELIDGPNLAEWLQKQNRVPPRLAAEILRGVARAVYYAHQHGVVHRDLKPGNILLRPLPGRRAFAFEPVVTDFGLARGPRPVEGSLLTISRAVLGTDHYMSPEQIGGKSDDVRAASDIFSLGVVLYELVAGRRPFDAETSDQVRRAICEDDAPSIRRWRREVPRDLETIIFKCLEKDPAQRYASAQELAEDLDRFLSGRPVHARRANFVAHGWKWVRRRPLAAALVTTSLLSAVAIAAMADLWISDRLAASRQIAAAEAATAVAEGIERQHQYAANIRHAAEALRRGGRREVAELLDDARRHILPPARPGIEWDYLYSQIHSADVSLAAHPAGATAVAFSPLGDVLVSGGRDGKIVMWNTVDWSRQRELTYADGVEITNLAFSADGALLAATGEDGRLVVYHTVNWSCAFEERLVAGRVFALAWLGDRNEIAIGGDGAVLTVVAPLSGERRARAFSVPESAKSREPGHPDEINSLIYLPTRDAFLALLTPRTTCFVAADSLADIVPLPAGEATVNSGCYVPLDEGYFATTDGQRNVDLWRASDGAKVAEISAALAVRSLRYSAAGGALLAACRDGTVATFNVRDALAGKPSQVRRRMAHDGRAVAIDASTDGRWLASAGLDGNVNLWRDAALSDPIDVPAAALPRDILFSPCGRWLAVSEYVSREPVTVVLYDAYTGKRLWSVAALPGEAKQNVPAFYCGFPLSFEAGGETIIIAEQDQVVRRRDARTGQALASRALPQPHGLTEVRVFSGTDHFVIREPYGDSELISFDTSDSVARFPGQTVALLERLSTGHGDLWIKYDAERHLTLRADPVADPLLTLTGFSERITAAAISPDGRSLVCGGLDHVVYVWDLERETTTPIKLIGHEDAISGLSFSTDGQTIISYSCDGTARLWHLATRAELLKFGARDEYVASMAIDPSGTLLVLGIDHNGRYGLQLQRLGHKGAERVRAWKDATEQDKSAAAK